MNSYKVGDSLKNFLTKLRAYDEEIPENLMDDVEDMADEMIEALAETENKENDACGKTYGKDEDELEEKIKKCVREVLQEVLEARKEEKDEAMTSLEEFETEDNFGEEVEEKEDEVGEESVIVSPEKATDSISSIIKRVKPIVANVKDSKERKLLSDSIAQLAKMNKKETTSDYNSIFKATRNNTKKQSSLNDDSFGDFLKKKYNPHYNKGE